MAETVVLLPRVYPACSTTQAPLSSLDLTDKPACTVSNSRPTPAMGAKKDKPKPFYAVAAGRQPGVFSTWEECKAQVDGFSCGRYKAFASREQAEAFVASGGVEDQLPGASCRLLLPRRLGFRLSIASARRGDTEDAGDGGCIRHRRWWRHRQQQQGQSVLLRCAARQWA